MIGGNRTRDFAFDEEPKRDTELTLGPWLVAGLGCALLAVCAVCFSVGYMLGRHAAAQPEADKAPAANTAVTGESTPATGAAAKPGARGASAAVPTPPADASETAEAEEAPAASASPAVKPALAASESAAAASAAHPPATNGWMVQIAAVARQEDADVLVSALRRRGYAVAARHVAGDSLIHVQVGPFINRVDANAMAQRLLGDGYNAAVQ